MANLSKRITAEHRLAIRKEIGGRLRNSISVAEEALPEAMERLLAKLHRRDTSVAKTN